MWSIRDEGIECEEIHEMKDHVNNLLVANSLSANSLSCFIPQGAGINVSSPGFLSTKFRMFNSHFVKIINID